MKWNKAYRTKLYWISKLMSKLNKAYTEVTEYLNNQKASKKAY